MKQPNLYIDVVVRGQVPRISSSPDCPTVLSVNWNYSAFSYQSMNQPIDLSNMLTAELVLSIISKAGLKILLTYCLHTYRPTPRTAFSLFQIPKAFGRIYKPWPAIHREYLGSRDCDPAVMDVVLPS